MTATGVQGQGEADLPDSPSGAVPSWWPRPLPGLSSVSAWLLRIVDDSIPEPIRNGDSETLRRARIILSFTLVLILLGLETGLFFAWILDSAAAERVVSPADPNPESVTASMSCATKPSRSLPWYPEPRRRHLRRFRRCRPDWGLRPEGSCPRRRAPSHCRHRRQSCPADHLHHCRYLQSRIQSSP